MARLPPGALRSAQVVAGGLIAGALLALAVTWFFRLRPGPGVPPLAYFAVAYAVVIAPTVAFFLRLRRPVPRVQPGEDPAVVVQAVQARTILSLGQLEGAVMFCAVAVMIGPFDWPLLAALVPLVLMMVWFPREE